MTDKSKFILNNDTQNYPFCRLKLAIEEFEHSTPTNQNSPKFQKVPKVVNPLNKEMLL